MTRFKFVAEDYTPWHIVDIEETYMPVKNPFPECSRQLPEGEYLIRGNRKSHRKKYSHCAGRWYLMDDRTKDNGQYYCDSAVYMLFPVLSSKEWESIRSAGWNRLNHVWQRHLFGYEHWLECRKIRRNTRKYFLEIDKKTTTE